MPSFTPAVRSKLFGNIELKKICGSNIIDVNLHGYDTINCKVCWCQKCENYNAAIYTVSPIEVFANSFFIFKYNFFLFSNMLYIPIHSHFL